MKKTMMATATALVLGLAVTAGAQAQAGVSVGLKGGLNSSTLVGKDAKAMGTISARQAFGGGAFMQVRLHRYFAIQPEVLYMRKGADIADVGISNTVKLDYIEVPLLAKVMIPTASPVLPYLFAGPQLSFKSACKASTTEGATTTTASCDQAPFNTKVKSTDFGAAFGGGFNFDAGGAVISLDARYTVGFTKLVDEATNNRVKNRAFSAMVGVSMPLTTKTFALRTH